MYRMFFTTTLKNVKFIPQVFIIFCKYKKHCSQSLRYCGHAVTQVFCFLQQRHLLFSNQFLGLSSFSGYKKPSLTEWTEETLMAGWVWIAEAVKSPALRPCQHAGEGSACTPDFPWTPERNSATVPGRHCLFAAVTKHRTTAVEATNEQLHTLF